MMKPNAEAKLSARKARSVHVKNGRSAVRAIAAVVVAAVVGWRLRQASAGGLLGGWECLWKRRRGRGGRVKPASRQQGALTAGLCLARGSGGKKWALRGTKPYSRRQQGEAALTGESGGHGAGQGCLQRVLSGPHYSGIMEKRMTIPRGHGGYQLVQLPASCATPWQVKRKA